MQTAYIGMGANISGPAGAPEETLAEAVKEMAALGRVSARSSLYSTEPVGYADQPRFVNAVIALETELAPSALLESLLRIEKDFGRDRSAGIANGPRTLDLDILLFGDAVIHEPGIEVPHPRLAERAFVLVPLAEIAANVMVVTQGRTVKELLQGLRRFPDANAIAPLESAVWHSGDVAVSPSTCADARDSDG
jgi:2-amino-4-hydroxy-6-hydroxymethyldihydropteridine diphosphokinase